MHALRRHRHLARLVLAWFALWTAAMVAAPAVAGGNLQIVCSGGSYKLVNPGQDGPGHLSGHLGQCPACVQVPALPTLDVAWQAEPAAAAPEPVAVLPVPVARRAAAPPAARGPPRFS